MAIPVGGKTLGIAVQCERGQGKVFQMQSRCRQRTEAADAVRTQIFCPHNL